MEKEYTVLDNAPELLQSLQRLENELRLDHRTEDVRNIKLARIALRNLLQYTKRMDRFINDVRSAVDMLDGKVEE